MLHVERHNRECKEPQAVDLQRAFIHVYRIDKAVTLRHIAASKNTLTIFPSNTSLGRVKQWKKTYPLDKKATQGPPDKNSNFGLDLTQSKRPLHVNWFWWWVCKDTEAKQKRWVNAICPDKMFLVATYAWSLLWIYFSCFLCIIYYSDIQKSQDSFRIGLFWKKSKGYVWWWKYLYWCHSTQGSRDQHVGYCFWGRCKRSVSRSSNR